MVSTYTSSSCSILDIFFVQWGNGQKGLKGCHQTIPKASCGVEGAFDWPLLPCRYVYLPHDWWGKIKRRSHRKSCTISETEKKSQHLNHNSWQLLCRILWAEYCLSDELASMLLYLRSPVCRCTWPCRIPWHLAGFCCSTARSEHLSQSRLHWGQSDKDVEKDKLVCVSLHQSANWQRVE